jgi:hypothetical protein
VLEDLAHYTVKHEEASGRNHKVRPLSSLHNLNAVLSRRRPQNRGPALEDPGSFPDKRVRYPPCLRLDLDLPAQLGSDSRRQPASLDVNSRLSCPHATTAQFEARSPCQPQLSKLRDILNPSHPYIPPSSSRTGALSIQERYCHVSNQEIFLSRAITHQPLEPVPPYSSTP